MRIFILLSLLLLPASADLEGDWRSIERGGNLQVRRLFEFALEASAADWHPERVEIALRKAEEMQDRDGKSATYGNFRWYWDEPGVTDRNAVEFAMERAGLVWKFHRERLTPGARETMQRMIGLAAEGIRRHRVSVGYTNIFLMKTWNCLALGESAGMPELAAMGGEMLDAWLFHTWNSGVREYLSPTYTGVDLGCLGLIANHCGNEVVRRKAEAALELLWTDLAANWFFPAARLGGAHSRDYDYLTGQGMLDRFIAAAGWPDDTKAAEDEFQRRCFHGPPAGLLDKFAVPRMVRQRWGKGAATAAHHVGRGISVGSAGESYPDMDKFLTVNFAGGPKMAGLNFLMDARRDPYGRRKERLGDHPKAWHITPFVTSVQRGPEVLLLADALPGSSDFRRVPEPDCLHSTFALPDGVGVFAGLRPEPLAKAGRTVLALADPVFLRLGDVAVGLRFVHASSESAGGPVLELVRDGGEFGAMRLSCIHSDAAPERRATVAVWVRGAEGLDDDGFAAFRKGFAAAGCSVSMAGGIHTVTAAGLEGELKLVADVEQRRRIEVAGAGPVPDDYLLLVDGRELGRPVLGRIGSLKEMVRRVDEHRSTLASGGDRAGVPVGEPFEAEAAPSVIEPFRVVADEKASGGKCLQVTDREGLDLPTAWVVEVPQDGDYSLWGRVLTPTPESDSFVVSVSQAGVPVVEGFDWHTGTRREWQWVRATGQKGAPLKLSLSKGRAVVMLGRRESGAMIDALRVEGE